MAAEARPDLEFRRLTKRYGMVEAVSSIDLAVPQGAFLAILGPSGCGKTTCLRMIGGFEQPTEGEVSIAGEVANGIPAYKRPVNMVFQHYALFPHMNVAQNVGYGLRQQRPRLPGVEIDRRVAEALEMVRLGSFTNRRSHEMSGGQQQRVALARAIVNRPKILLLDEPLAALDKKLRSDMQLELLQLQQELGITFVLVTHDQEEALSMADLVCVMNAGRISQLGTPQEVYDHPADLFVADFVGKTNRIRVTVEGGVLRLADGRALPGTSALLGPSIAALRPEAIRISRSGEGLPGTVIHRIFLGSFAEYAVAVAGIGDILVTTDRRGAAEADLIAPGEAVRLSYDPTAVLVFPQ